MLSDLFENHHWLAIFSMEGNGCFSSVERLLTLGTVDLTGLMITAVLFGTGQQPERNAVLAPFIMAFWTSIVLFPVYMMFAFVYQRAGPESPYLEEALTKVNVKIFKVREGDKHRRLPLRKPGMRSYASHDSGEPQLPPEQRRKTPRAAKKAVRLKLKNRNRLAGQMAIRKTCHNDNDRRWQTVYAFRCGVAFFFVTVTHIRLSSQG